MLIKKSFMKKAYFIVLLLAFNVAYSQEDEQEKMISRFVLDLFDKSIDPEIVFDEYISTDQDNLKASATKRKKLVIQIIKETRKNKKDNGWLIPNPEIRKLDDPKVFPYEEVKGLSEIQLQFNTSGEFKDRIYVLTNDKETEILQYFLMSEDKMKIKSFTLFVKAKNSGWFFQY